MIVVDASAIIEVLLRTNRALQIEERFLSAGETLHAPHLDVPLITCDARLASAPGHGAEIELVTAI